jgi:hypothetical protein
VRKAVTGDLFPEYAGPSKLRRAPGNGVRDSEHCALKWGTRSNNLPSTGVGTVSDPYRELRQELGSSPEASVPSAVREIKVLSIFYGYPAALVARWCGVSPATASLWKQNKRKPSRQGYYRV